MKKAVSILVLFLCFMCFPLKAEGKTVEIYTAYDLVKLAKECHYDAYSKDLRVELMSDISLRDVKDFSLIYAWQSASPKRFPSGYPALRLLLSIYPR